MDSSPLDFTSRGKLCQFETIIQKLLPQDFKSLTILNKKFKIMLMHLASLIFSLKHSISSGDHLWSCCVFEIRKQNQCVYFKISQAF